ncbi:hypothetical protein CYJ68_04760 [Gardnerella vaginalis]|nr:hypothetical protein CYJ68_04760 [Gardnerella vaginalis]
MKMFRIWSLCVQVFYGFLKSYMFILAVGVVVSAGALILFIYYQDIVGLSIVLTFVKHFYCGLVAGFAVHELAHAFLISLTMCELKYIIIESTFARFSIKAVGTSTGRGVFLVALCGPVVASLFGICLNFMFPNSGLIGWYIFHLFYLLPIFADGRSIIFGIRHWSSVVYIGK